MLPELATIDSEIAQLEARLHDLQTKCKAIQTLLKECHTILSPIRRLPADILCEIFYHCLPVHRNPILSTLEAPILLTHISSTWRFVALSSPRLWAQLHITFSEDSPIDSLLPSHTNERRLRTAHILQLRCDIVKSWLTRSGAFPLSISVCYTTTNRIAEEGGYREDDFTSMLFKVILCHKHRWETIELSMPMEIYRRFEALFSVDSLSTLTGLRLNLYEPQLQLHKPQHRIALLDAPNLRKVSIFGAQSSMNDFQWARRLTSLFCHTLVTIQNSLELLKLCVNIVHCKLFIRYGSIENSVSSVSLPHLRALGIVTHDIMPPATLNRFYNAIDAPHLKCFEHDQDILLDMTRTDTAPDPPFLSLLRHSVQLQRLTLHKKMSVLHWRAVLATVSQSLTHLVIGPEPQGPLRFTQRKDHAWRISLPPMATFFDLQILIVENKPESLTSTSNSSAILLPNLQVLEVTSGGTHITDDQLLRFITSRMDPLSSRGVAALQHVKVIFDRIKEMDVGEAVEKFRETKLATGAIEVASPKLNLDYPVDEPFKSTNPLSPSFQLTEDGRSWNPPFSDIEVSMVPPD